LGWNDYNPKLESQKNMDSFGERMCKKVICLTTGEVFNSQTEAGIKYNIFSSTMSNCCQHKKNTKSAGKHPSTGEKLVWLFYEEYLEIQNIK